MKTKTKSKKTQSKKRKQAKPKFKRTARKTSVRSEGLTIDLTMDYSNTLKELSRDVIDVFYAVHYVPIKQLCAVHNSLLKTSYRHSCVYIEHAVDAKIELMNAFLSDALDAARASRRSHAERINKTAKGRK